MSVKLKTAKIYLQNYILYTYKIYVIEVILNHGVLTNPQLNCDWSVETFVYSILLLVINKM